MFPDNSKCEAITESFYLESKDGLFFAVKGIVHPPDRVVAVLRYAPDPAGDRKREGISYRRLYHFAEQEQLLRSCYPHYIALDPVFQTKLQSVPRSDIRRVHDPRARLMEFSGAHARDAVLADAADFTGLLQRESGVPNFAIGVTGSLLISMHRESSDLDICVYGQESCLRVYGALASLLNSGAVEGLSRLDDQGIRELYLERVTDTDMGFAEFAEVEKKKTCQGRFRGRPYFIRFIKHANETGERYGDLYYQAVGRARIRAVVAEDRDSIFTPCNYPVSEVRLLEGTDVPIDVITSFRGRFCEQARTGDAVAASGTVERVENFRGEVRYRLLLGSSREDTMTRCSW